MRYLSTRNKQASFTGAEAILRGLSPDGGLLVPESIPTILPSTLKTLADMSYPERAGYIMSLFLDDFSRQELTEYAREAYSEAKFDNGEAAPLRQTGEREYFLELWHGPTSAFKDIALQMLPRLMSASLAKTGERRDACILVATSGDTGKAALEGFRDVPRVKIMVFYPRDGVSDVQKLQMTTQEGKNVGVCAVRGNFDDAQAGVKAIFADKTIARSLENRGYFLSSANSINWGRLVPQIAYYFSAYCDLMKSGAIKQGERINFCVPTGNFGNILAGWYAKEMGLPVNRLICASNRNRILEYFIRTGRYSRVRKFHTTISPSMDIVVSSNLERLLFTLSGGNDKLTGRLMKRRSKFDVAEDMAQSISQTFSSGSCNDEDTRRIIKRVFKEKNYLIDTHTAVAYGVYEKYKQETGDNAVNVILSTASPFKFCTSVLRANGRRNFGKNGLDAIKRLEKFSGVTAPAPLKALFGKPERFNKETEKQDMPRVVANFVGVANAE
ncbi:MAG: threonine synthase [Oscillospiraceae bacterium]|jgi:threonine synthase|nr:threonine synthase [Oscillospiraceae bacterium]